MSVPSDAEIRATLHQLARTTLHREGDLPDGDLAEHLDSAERLALVIAIEDHWAIAFDEADDEAATVDDVVAIVRRHLSAPPAADA